MLTIARILAVGAAGLAIAACAEERQTAADWIDENVPQERYQRALKAEPTGSQFNRGLYKGYLELAATERAEYDWSHSRHFSKKALAAAEDQDVDPDPLYDRKISSEALAELKAARKSLAAALDRGARLRVPARAAEAQVSFDCWVQEQEEDHQPADIAACRDRFYAAIGGVQSAMGLEGRSDYVVYFGSGSAEVAEQQLEKVMDAAAIAKGRSVKVLVSGHADQTGADARNLALSQERAAAVEKLLLSAGVKSDQIITSRHGTAQPVVATGPGTAEARNRRVEINLVK